MIEKGTVREDGRRWDGYVWRKVGTNHRLNEEGLVFYKNQYRTLIMASSSPSMFLYAQALAVKQLQDILGDPLAKRRHVYYTKLITNGRKLHYAIFLFTLLNII